MKTTRKYLALGELIIRFYLLPTSARVKFYAQFGGYRKKRIRPLILEYILYGMGYTLLILLMIPERQNPMIIPGAIIAGVSFAMYTLVPKLAKIIRQI